jgi:zinc and cadmium transporter
VVDGWHRLFPYLMVAAASSFIYVAVADLLPQMQRRVPLKDLVAQVVWIAVGLGFIVFAISLMQGH